MLANTTVRLMLLVACRSSSTLTLTSTTVMECRCTDAVRFAAAVGRMTADQAKVFAALR